MRIKMGWLLVGGGGGGGGEGAGTLPPMGALIFRGEAYTPLHSMISSRHFGRCLYCIYLNILGTVISCFCYWIWRVSDVFRGFRKGTLAWDGLNFCMWNSASTTYFLAREKEIRHHIFYGYLSWWLFLGSSISYVRTKIFRKTNISYPLICTRGGKRC